MKELLASAVLQMKAKAQWEVAGYSGQSQGLAQSTDAGGISLLLPSLSCMRTETDTGSVTAPQASERPQSSCGSRRQQLGRRCGSSQKAQPSSGCPGPKQQPRALLPLEGHSEAKVWVLLLCPSSPRESITVQLNNTWRSRVQPPFPLGQSSLFKRTMAQL